MEQVRDFANSPAVGLTPTFINTADVLCLVKQLNAVKSGKAAFLRVDVLTYC